jgi:predicted GIY-YIG superfamily endonuclease
MKYFTYVLKSINFSKSYVGMTHDIHQRLLEHNSGKSFYTRRYLPWVVIHTEEYDNLHEARKREMYLKSASGRKFLKKLFKN